jgi:triosephosphate isomerase
MAEVTAPTVLGVSLKMYFDHQRTLEWSREVALIARRHDALLSGAVDLFVLPSFPSIVSVLEIFSDTVVHVGAQDLFWNDRGPFTGEVSGFDLEEIGCRYVEVGHAERRRMFGEDDETVARKTAAALRNGLTPVLCVGETDRVVPAVAARLCIEQLQAALGVAEHDGVAGPLVVAYEPEWAIGAEASASPVHIREVCAVMTAWLEEHPLVASSRVIYGGSAGPGLLTVLGDSIDGLFLGRFAHDTASLERVLDEAMLFQGHGL